MRLSVGIGKVNVYYLACAELFQVSRAILLYAHARIFRQLKNQNSFNTFDTLTKLERSF